MVRGVQSGVFVLATVCAQTADAGREYPRSQMGREGWSLTFHCRLARKDIGSRKKNNTKTGGIT